MDTTSFVEKEVICIHFMSTVSYSLQCNCRELGERGQQEDFSWSGKSQNAFLIFKQDILRHPGSL